MHNMLQSKLMMKQKMCKSTNKVCIHKLRRKQCNNVYTGHMSRSFRIRYKGHLHDIRCSKNNSIYAKHILNTQQRYGKIHKFMQILKIMHKECLMDTWNQYIYKYDQKIMTMYTHQINQYNVLLN